MKKTSVGRILLRWILGVLGTAFTALVVSLVVPYLQGSLIDAWLPQFAALARDWVTYPVPAWIIAAALAAILFFRWVGRRIARKANPDAELRLRHGHLRPVALPLAVVEGQVRSPVHP